MASLAPGPAVARRPGPGRGGVLILLALIVLVGGVFMPLTLLAFQSDMARLTDTRLIEVAVKVEGGKLTPTEIRVPAGRSVRVTFTNADPSSPHEFRTARMYKDAQLVLWPGEQRQIVFVAPSEPGRYGFFCALRDHGEGEFGTIVVG